MPTSHQPNFIERFAEKLHLIPNLREDLGAEVPRLTEPDALTNYPPPEKWDDWVEYEAKHLPTICFNCEAG